jgi:AraC-like DNA-binding protein
MRNLYLFDFPDALRADSGLDLICPELGWSNMITLTTGSDAGFPPYQGTLSVKCAFRGEEVYEADGVAHRVRPGSYLILNHGQRYSSYIPSRESVESLCIFFRPGFAESLLRDLLTPDDRLLDDPAGNEGGTIRFAELVYTHDDLVAPMLSELHDVLVRRQPERGWLEERFHIMLPRLLQVHRGVVRGLQRVPSLRSGTRLEIYRRLNIARGFIHDNYSRRIGLAEMASAAHLSVHHFLRLFKSLYGATPHQYLTRLRLGHAGDLLRRTDRSINDICFDSGFESPTSFSLLFRRHFGVAPSHFRRDGSRDTGDGDQKSNFR